MCIIFFTLQQFISAISPNEENKNHLFIDFGGKYVKASLHDLTKNSYTYLTNSEKISCSSAKDCYNIPNSISSSIDDMFKNNITTDAVRIGNEALKKVEDKKILGIEFFGAIYNRNPSYLSQNNDLFNIDKNITIYQYPILWYVTQFYSKYKSKTKADSLTMILPGYTTDLSFEELNVSNNATYKNIEFFRDYSIIERIHSNFFSKENNKNVLYLDFGAFSAKATLVNKENRVVFYGFDEECGIEKVAYRKAKSNQIETEKITHEKVDENNIYDNHVLKAREKSYSDISSDSFYDELFERNLNNLIVNAQIKSEIDEIILVGGGCELPFVTKAVENVSKDIKFDIIEKVAYNKFNISHFTYLVDGLKLPSITSPNDFTFHSLYLHYDEDYKICEQNSFLVNSNFTFQLGKLLRNDKKNSSEIWNDRIKIVTDDSCVIGGMSKTVLKLKIQDVNSDKNKDLVDGKLIQLNGSFDPNKKEGIPLKFSAEFCDVNDKNFLVCNANYSIGLSNSTSVKYEKASKQALATDTAMIFLRTLISEMKSKMKNKDEL